MELVGGIRMFMKRDDKCKKFVIANKNNKDIVSKLESLQKDLGDYCSMHRPHLNIEEKTKNGKPYRYRYYKNNNDYHFDNDPDVVETKNNDDDDDGNGDDEIYLAMKDIYNTITSILRHVKRYKDHCEIQRNLREIWRKTTKKGKQSLKKEKMNKRKSSTSSSS